MSLKKKVVLITTLVGLFIFLCSLIEKEKEIKVKEEIAFIGKASYYADKFNGRKTANGEIFNNKKLTAAHRTLPFGTKVKITNLKNDSSVIVTINDRGPYIKGRDLDLSKKAMQKLNAVDCGVIPTKYTIVVEPLKENEL